MLSKFSRFVDRTVDPETTIEVIIGRPRLIVLKQGFQRAQLGEAKTPVADLLVVTPKELSIIGRQPGSTVLNIWFANPKDPARPDIISYLVRVVPDLEGVEQAREHLRVLQQRFYKALETDINRAFPDSLICLSLVGNDLIVSGQAKDIADATQILRVVTSNAPRVRRGGQGAPLTQATFTQSTSEVGLTGTQTQTTQEAVTPLPGALPEAGPGAPPGALPGALPPPGGAGTQPTEEPRDVLGVNVINLMRVPGEQQVMLKVTVAEINRAAARSIGVNFSIQNSAGMTVFAQTTGNILGSTTGGTTAGGITSGVGSAANLIGIIDRGRLNLAINALRTLDFARTLAEPDLTTLNGQPATFRAGGEFPVPVVTGFTAAGLQGVSFVPFGVQLSFTPFITDKDRIRLLVQADVSTKDLSSSANVNGTSVPGLNTRNFQTTVELREGQTLAVAGLLQTNYGADATRVPFFGDLPIIGRFAAFDRTSAGEQELVVLVTPELVHPLEPKECPPLPGSDVFEPGDIEFYLLGRLESRREYDYRSPVRTDIHRMIRYRHCEQLFINGPSGHADGKP